MIYEINSNKYKQIDEKELGGCQECIFFDTLTKDKMSTCLIAIQKEELDISCYGKIFEEFTPEKGVKIKLKI